MKIDFVTVWFINTTAAIAGGTACKLFFVEEIIYINRTNIGIILPIALVVSVIIILTKWKSIIIKAYSELLKGKSIKHILLFGIFPIVIGIFWFLLLLPFFIPPFEITYPENNAEVPQLISVKGHGAIPGSEIKVFVIDPQGKEWLQPGTKYTNMKGYWEHNTVYIGEQYIGIGKKYTIYASLETLKGTNYSTKSIQVIRSHS